jgi:hypothetical protein
MGDKSLMKNIIFITLVFTAFIYGNLSVSQIEQMVMKIHEQRPGADLETLERTKEPFVRLAKENNVTTFVVPIKIEEIKISLHAIMADKAYINDSWLAVDDSVMGYTLKYIGKRGVVLRNGNHIKKLFLHKNSDDFIKIEGR